jgi:hypothetical protein
MPSEERKQKSNNIVSVPKPISPYLQVSHPRAPPESCGTCRHDFGLEKIEKDI